MKKNKQKKRPTSLHEGIPTKQTQKNDNSLPAQRQRLLTYLKQKPITTLEARNELNILSPAPRVHELRHRYGFNIETALIESFSEEGYRHKIAKYTLLPDKSSGGLIC